MESPDDEPTRPGDIFDRSTIHTTAAWVIVCELRRFPLQWSESKQPVDDHTWYFVQSLVRQFMAYGYAVWRNARGTLQTAENAVVSRKTPHSRWKVTQLPDSTVATRGWRVHAFVHPPVWALEPSAWDWPSPLRASLPHLRVVEQIQANWLSRDSHNSRPSVFTNIDLQAHVAAGGAVDGKAVHLPAYRTLGGPELNPAASSYAGTFQQLIDDRHDAIRKLSEKSTLEREAILGAGPVTPLDHVNRATEPAAELLHEEHIVTDGKRHTETKTLLSTSDGRFHYDRARQNVFFSLGVPPQAVGETVNSERTASAAATFDTAISHFLATVRIYRNAVAAVLQEATTLPTGEHVAFEPGLSSIQLERVMPYLKPARAKRLLAQVYELDPADFDLERITAQTAARLPPGKGPQQTLNEVSGSKTQSKRFKETE